MNQTKLASLIEQILNVSSGFIISLIFWVLIIVPLWDLEVTMLDNVSITVCFTVISVVRGYFWRRLFNGEYPQRALWYVVSRISRREV